MVQALLRPNSSAVRPLTHEKENSQTFGFRQNGFPVRRGYGEQQRGARVQSTDDEDDDTVHNLKSCPLLGGSIWIDATRRGSMSGSDIVSGCCGHRVGVGDHGSQTGGIQRGHGARHEVERSSPWSQVREMRVN